MAKITKIEIFIFFLLKVSDRYSASHPLNTGFKMASSREPKAFCNSCKKKDTWLCDSHGSCANCCTMCTSCQGCGRSLLAAELCTSCKECQHCCEKTKDQNDGLCNEEEIRQKSEEDYEKERKVRRAAMLRERQKKKAFVAARGVRTFGNCDCHGQGWVFVPHATKDDSRTYTSLCSLTDHVEYMALRLGYYLSVRAAKKD
jgi:hypothetical protein